MPPVITRPLKSPFHRFLLIVFVVTSFGSLGLYAIYKANVVSRNLEILQLTVTNKYISKLNNGTYSLNFEALESNKVYGISIGRNISIYDSILIKSISLNQKYLFYIERNFFTNKPEPLGISKITNLADYVFYQKNYSYYSFMGFFFLSMSALMFIMYYTAQHKRVTAKKRPYKRRKPK
ncbi:MAG: hypothetical protein KA783_02060 [Chitinophagales bacterium]|jgi:hypothetical protein|nr:hypothetical protein [Chitinophagales bacterium]